MKRFIGALETIRVVREAHMEGRSLVAMVVADKKKEK
jgi:hypothetical protein